MERAISTDVREAGMDGLVGGLVGAWEYGDAPPAGWEGLTVATAENPDNPWATVLVDSGGKRVTVMPWEFWRNDLPTKVVSRARLVVYVPNKR